MGGGAERELPIPKNTADLTPAELHNEVATLRFEKGYPNIDTFPAGGETLHKWRRGEEWGTWCRWSEPECFTFVDDGNTVRVEPNHSGMGAPEGTGATAETQHGIQEALPATEASHRIGGGNFDHLEKIGKLQAVKAGGPDRLPSILYTGGRKTLFHYSDAKRISQIAESRSLWRSQGSTHARFGDGQYLADISPDRITARTKQGLTPAQLQAGELSLGQLSSKFYRRGNMTSKIDHYVEIDITGLVVRQGVGKVTRSGMPYSSSSMTTLSTSRGAWFASARCSNDILQVLHRIA